VASRNGAKKSDEFGRGCQGRFAGISDRFAERYQGTVSGCSKQPKEWLKSVEVSALFKISAGTLQPFGLKANFTIPKSAVPIIYRCQEVQKMLEAESR
jgi:hypothetical protein